MEELKTRSQMVVNSGKHGIVVFYHRGKIYAVDNRCPHMGFPLSRGTLKDGLLICHWHHARFELSSGGTFDPWADNVASYPIKVMKDEVWVSTEAKIKTTVEAWKERLKEGLDQGLPLIVAKALTSMIQTNVAPEEIVKIGALHGCHYRREGWGSGLTTLTALTNLLHFLPLEDKILAILHGMTSVIGDTSGHAPSVRQQPLLSKPSTSMLKKWFRDFVEGRDSEGAERCLLTAIQYDTPRGEIADMMFSAATDHYFLDGGHTLDFINKSFELLEHIDWEYAPEILPTLVKGLCEAERHEEENTWRHPTDLVTLLQDVFEELPTLVKQGKNKDWNNFHSLIEILLGDFPDQIILALKEAIATGAKATQLSLALAYAASQRILRFNIQNEFSDWNTVHHTFTYCNALHKSIKRANSTELLRGVFHGAMKLYLDRFLNIPPAPLPRQNLGTKSSDEFLTQLLEILDMQQRVDEASEIVYGYLQSELDEEVLWKTLCHALIREDVGFHSIQNLEAGYSIYKELPGIEEKRRVLLATTRFLAAHSPTPRALFQTATIAIRVQRGEDLYQAEIPQS